MSGVWNVLGRMCVRVVLVEVEGTLGRVVLRVSREGILFVGLGSICLSLIPKGTKILTILCRSLAVCSSHSWGGETIWECFGWNWHAKVNWISLLMIWEALFDM